MLSVVFHSNGCVVDHSVGCMLYVMIVSFIMLCWGVFEFEREMGESVKLKLSGT